MPALLTVREFAAEARVSVRTVHRWLASGVIPCQRFGATVRIPVSALGAGEPISTNNLTP